MELLDLSSLGKIALVDTRFSHLFEEESHWRPRTQKEFSKEVSRNPSPSWRNYYRFLRSSSHLPPR
uniref:Uncharacterized protein n=1 Tax=viral metagenome TaxID=1070528 RepID=A0A6C0IZ57_9ZZZZ